MAAYRFKAAASDGQVVEGTIDAIDRDGAARALQAQGKIPLRIDDSAPPSSTAAHPQNDWRGRRIPRSDDRLKDREVDYFTLELATLLRAELPLGEALDTLATTAEQPSMAKRAETINDAVRSGKTLSTAIAESGPEFDGFYCSMVRAGESSGALGHALEGLAAFRRHRRETRDAVFSALLYPSILLIMAVVAVAVLLAFVVPQFTQMFADAGRDLPLLTRIVAGAGHIVTHWWWLILALAAGLVYLARRDWQTTAGRTRWDNFFLRMPVVGTLVRKVQIARFSRTLATLLNSGVHLLPALDIASEIVNNTAIAAALRSTKRRVQEGAGLATPLSESGLLPPLAMRLIHIGESSGRLEFMLLQLADIYEKDAQAALKRLFTLAEPVIIIFIALLISVIILSVVLVILESNNLAF